MHYFDLNSPTGPIAWYLSGICLFLVLEYVIPFRAATLSRLRRWRINFSMNFFNVLLVDMGFMYLLKKTTLFSGPIEMNVFEQLHFGPALRIVFTILILDLAMYVWHRMNHVIPFLWRFHRVHHTDLNVDVSSAARFHFGEVTGSAVITYTLMLIFGATLFEVRLFQVFLFSMAQFEHSNIKLPRKVDEFLWCFLVPPAMHRIHHSNKKDETDSNYGTIFSFWDRMFGTFKKEVEQDKIEFGLKEFNSPKELMLLRLLALPFKGMLRSQKGGALFKGNSIKGGAMRKIILLPFILALCSPSIAMAEVAYSRFYSFDYQIVFKGLDEIPEGKEKLNLWVPRLPDTPYQHVEEVTITPEGIATITEDGQYGNTIIHFSLDTPVDPNLEININYKIRRKEYSKKGIDIYLNEEPEAEDFSKYLKANKLVTLSPRIQEMAFEITKGKETTLQKARAIYDYVFDNVSYDKSVPGYGRGDTERVCNIKAGNCTDFHSLFISLARASHIPAKFVIGVPLSEDEQGELGHYHCWAEFYDEQLGWVPVDISEAWKDKAKKEYHFGAIDANRLEFSRGRDIILSPAQQAGPLNYFIYPHAEVDGEIFKTMGVLFKYKNIKETLERVSVNPETEQVWTN